MRFNNDDYLRAFPREDPAPAPIKQTIKEQSDGDVFDTEGTETPPAPEDSAGSDDEEGGTE